MEYSVRLCQQKISKREFLVSCRRLIANDKLQLRFIGETKLSIMVFQGISSNTLREDLQALVRSSINHAHFSSKSSGPETLFGQLLGCIKSPSC